MQDYPFKQRSACLKPTTGGRESGSRLG